MPAVTVRELLRRFAEDNRRFWFQAHEGGVLVGSWSPRDGPDAGQHFPWKIGEIGEDYVRFDRLLDPKSHSVIPLSAIIEVTYSE